MIGWTSTIFSRGWDSLTLGMVVGAIAARLRRQLYAVPVVSLVGGVIGAWLLSRLRCARGSR